MKITIVLLALILLLAGCQAASPAPATGNYPAAAASQPPAAGLTFTDGLGRTVKLDQPARRIVSLAPSNTEILYAVGAGPQVIGRDDLSDYPVEVKKLPTVGGSMSKFNYEAIAGLKPDLVLAAGLTPPEQVKALADLGLKVYALENPTDLEGMYASVETVGRLTGKETEAQQLVGSLKARVAAVEARLANVATRPTVFYELDGSDPAKPYTTGPGTFVDSLITMAGGKNVAADLGAAWGQIGTETLLVKNPDIILLGDAAYGISPDSLSKRPGWDGLTAVKEGKIYTFDDNLVSRPDPRLVDGLEEIARLIHPEAK